MGVVVIVGYKPLPGKESELEALMKTHLPILRREKLVTDRESIIVKSKNGTIIEVFEWISEEVMQNAHGNKTVLAMWQEYEKVCEYVPVATVPEAQALFSGFSPL